MGRSGEVLVGIAALAAMTCGSCNSSPEHRAPTTSVRSRRAASRGVASAASARPGATSSAPAKRLPAKSPAREPTYPLRLGVPRSPLQMVNDLALSEDGRLLAVASSDRTVQLWDLPKRKRLAVLRGHKGQIQAVAVSPDGSRLASGDNGGRVLLWSRDGKLLHRYSHSAALKVHALAFSPDGKLLAAGLAARQALVLGTSKPYKTIRTIEATCDGMDCDDNATDDLAFLSNRRLLLAVFGWLHIHVPRSGKLIASWPDHDSDEVQRCDPKKICTGWVVTTALAPSRRRVAVVNRKGCVRLYLVNGACSLARKSWQARGRPGAAAFTPDSKQLVVGGERGALRVIQVGTRRLVRQLTRPMDADIRAVLVTPAGELITAGQEKVVRISDLQGGKAGTLAIHPGPVKDPGPLHHHGVVGLAFSADGKQLQSLDTNDETLLWSLARGRALGPGKRPAAGCPLRNPSTDAYGQGPLQRRLVKAQQLSRLQDIDHLLTKDQGPCIEGCDIQPVVVSGDLKLAAYFYRWQLYLARLEGKRRVRMLPRRKAHRVAAFAQSSGRWLATQTKKHALVLHDTSQPKVTFGPFRGHSAQVDALDVSSDGALLATGDDNGKVMVWELKSGRQLQTLELEGGAVTTLAFGPRGRLLAGAAFDRSLTVWQLKTPQR